MGGATPPIRWLGAGSDRVRERGVDCLEVEVTDASSVLALELRPTGHHGVQVDRGVDRDPPASASTWMRASHKPVNSNARSWNDTKPLECWPGHALGCHVVHVAEVRAGGSETKRHRGRHADSDGGDATYEHCAIPFIGRDVTGRPALV